MELVIGDRPESRLEQLAKEAVLSTSRVDVAVAYVDQRAPQMLFDLCWKSKIPVTLWARYDYSVPVAITVLEWFLNKGSQSANYVCKLVDKFHPKVIWWHGFGAYIGSANLGHSAWYYNIEAGVFLSEDEIAEQGIREDLVRFFEEIDEASTQLHAGIVAQMNALLEDAYQKAENDARRRFSAGRLIPERKPNVIINKAPLVQRQRTRFLDEWNETLGILQKISQRVSADEFRPDWISAATPKGAQADQFLNAYYYQNVGGTTEKVHEFHELNKGDIDVALLDAMRWWKGLDPERVAAEEETLNRWAPFLEQQFGRETLTNLTPDGFAEVCLHVHAMLEYGRQVRYESMGMKPTSMKKLDRCKLFAHWLYKQKASNGNTTLQTIDYVLHGGDTERTPERIFQVCFTPEMKIPHLGINSLGELVGWAKPNEMPPRNGRTNKALHALGYKMKNLSETA